MPGFALAAALLLALPACGGGGGGSGGGGGDGGAGAGLDAGPGGDGGTDPGPGATEPALLLPGTGLYPRALLLQHGAHAGEILASVVAPQQSGHLGGTILASSDDGVSFTPVGAIDEPAAARGLCCATLYELPQAVGGLPAGTVLWAASVGGDDPTQPMAIPVWKSLDGGRTWAPLSTVVTAGVPRSSGGLWEPEFSVRSDGQLVCHYSDETDPAHSQKLVERASPDGVSWSGPRDTVALAVVGRRPGMAVVRRLPSGSYVMSYEICGVPGDDCTAHLRTSADGWDYGSAGDAGLRPTTVDGLSLRHAPTLAVADAPGANGRFYLIGQLAFTGTGQVAPENGTILLGNSETGTHFWYPVTAPVPVPDATNNFCPNYSSPLVPLDGDSYVLELATRWDGQVCQAYFARGPLLGSRTAAGLAAGTTYRMTSLMSGLCLDVAGGSTDPGGNIQQWTCNALPPQDWSLGAAGGDGLFTLTSRQSNLCLTVAGDPAPGANVVQQPCDGSAAQTWAPAEVGISTYVLHQGGAASDLCLDVAGGSIDPGGNIQIWSCNQLAPQMWRAQVR